MALEEQGQQSVWEFIKKWLKKGLHVIKEALFQKMDKAMERCEFKDIKHLVKKHRNMGVCVVDDLSEQQAKSMCKELRKMHQAYVTPEKYTNANGIDRWKIHSVGVNNELLKELKAKYAPQQNVTANNNKPQSFAAKLAAAKAKAAAHNAKVDKSRQHAPEKHTDKDISL